MPHYMRRGKRIRGAEQTFLKQIKVSRLSMEQRGLLNDLITPAEVVAVVKILNKGRAPGPDGYLG